MCAFYHDLQLFFIIYYTLSYVKRDYDKPSNNPKSLEISYYPGKLRSTKQTWRANLISGPNPISPGQSMTSCFHLVPRHQKWLWTIIATLQLCRFQNVSRQHMSDEHPFYSLPLTPYGSRMDGWWCSQMDSGEVFLNLRFAFKCHCCVDAPTTTYIKWFYLGDIPLNKEQHERMLDNISTEESIRQSISRIIVSISTQVIARYRSFLFSIHPFSIFKVFSSYNNCQVELFTVAQCYDDDLYKASAQHPFKLQIYRGDAIEISWLNKSKMKNPSISKLGTSFLPQFISYNIKIFHFHG